MMIVKFSVIWVASSNEVAQKHNCGFSCHFCCQPVHISWTAIVILNERPNQSDHHLLLLILQRCNSVKWKVMWWIYKGHVTFSSCNMVPLQRSTEIGTFVHILYMYLICYKRNVRHWMWSSIIDFYLSHKGGSKGRFSGWLT